MTKVNYYSWLLQEQTELSANQISDWKPDVLSGSSKKSLIFQEVLN